MDVAALYAQALAGKGLPTPEQTAAFAEYVSSAHSWYKHLPLTPPLAAFVFYLDPNAGRQIVRTKDRRWIYTDRPEGEQFFHYNEMPTTEYHQRFGIWNYHSDGSPQFMVRSSGGAVIATAEIYDRMEAIMNLEVPNYPLAEYRAPQNYPVRSCPLCESGVPITSF